MLDTKAITKAVCRVVVAATGLSERQVIIGDPNAASPSGTYCAVRLDSPVQFGQALNSERSVPALDNPDYMDIISVVATQFTIGFSLNFYRAGAMSLASGICEANKREHICQILRAAGLGWSRVTPINNLTGLYQAAMEERANMTLYLYGQSVVEDRVNRIYRVKTSVEDKITGAIAQGSINGLSG